MQTTLLILASLLPVFVLLWYFERQDKGQKEPHKLKRKIFLWGVIVIIFAAIMELVIDELFIPLGTETLMYAFLTSFITAAIIEEAWKLWVVKKFVYYTNHFNEYMDGITYTILASLGFAAFENVLYVLEGGFTVAIIRAFLSVPAHAMFSGIMGYYIAKAKFLKAPFISSRYVWLGYFFAVLYHGLFNFFLLSGSWMMFLVIPLMVTMAMHLKTKIKQAHFDDKLSNITPKGISFWGIIRSLTAVALILFGISIIAGSVMLSQDLAFSVGFGLVIIVFAYFLIRKKKA